MKLEVTQADIDAGVRGNCSWCPVAQSLKRATGIEQSQVHLDEIRVWSRRWLRIKTPDEILDFIEEFDADPDHKPEPATFDLPDLNDWAGWL
jgi:hypothetical protein